MQKILQASINTKAIFTLITLWLISKFNRLHHKSPWQKFSNFQIKRIRILFLNRIKIPLWIDSLKTGTKNSSRKDQFSSTKIKGKTNSMNPPRKMNHPLLKMTFIYFSEKMKMIIQILSSRHRKKTQLTTTKTQWRTLSKSRKTPFRAQGILSTKKTQGFITEAMYLKSMNFGKNKTETRAFQKPSTAKSVSSQELRMGLIPKWEKSLTKTNWTNLHPLTAIHRISWNPTLTTTRYLRFSVRKNWAQ